MNKRQYTEQELKDSGYLEIGNGRFMDMTEKSVDFYIRSHENLGKFEFDSHYIRASFTREEDWRKVINPEVHYD